MNPATLITRNLTETNPEASLSLCSKYLRCHSREDWSDDRGNLSRFVYVKGNTHHWFTKLNGVLVESGWMYVRGG